MTWTDPSRKRKEESRVIYTLESQVDRKENEGRVRVRVLYEVAVFGIWAGLLRCFGGGPKWIFKQSARGRSARVEASCPKGCFSLVLAKASSFMFRPRIDRTFVCLVTLIIPTPSAHPPSTCISFPSNSQIEPSWLSHLCSYELLLQYLR